MPLAPPQKATAKAPRPAPAAAPAQKPVPAAAPQQAPATAKPAGQTPRPAQAGPQRQPETAAAAPVQAKAALPTSQPGDRAEREADARATQVMRSAAVAPPVQAGLPVQPGQAPAAASGDQAAGPVLSAEDQARLGPGEPLPPDVQALLEPRFGAPLGHVRVMTDGAAASAAAAIQARAFTLGHRIGFASGEYQPATPAGQWLLAHEITHVLQQQDGSVPRVVMRECVGGCADAPAPPRRSEASRAADRHLMQPQNGTLDDAGPTLRFDTVEVPGFKLQGHRGTTYGNRGVLGYSKNYRRGNPDQANKWRAGIDKSSIQSTLQQKLSDSHLSVAAGATLAFEVPVQGRSEAGRATATQPGRRGPVYFGDVATVAEVLTIPQWGRGARPPARAFHVDHIVELQLARWDRDYASWPNTLANMELLDGRINQESGCIICKSIEGKLARHITAARWPDGDEPTPRRLKQTHHIEFARAVSGGRGPASIEDNDHWKPSEIEAGLHLGPVQVINPAEVGGSAGVVIFSRETGGMGKTFPLDFGDWVAHQHNWLKPFRITGRQFRTSSDEIASGEDFGSFQLALPENDPHFEGTPEPVRIQRVPGAAFAGRVQKASLMAALRGLHYKGASPIEVPDVEVDPEAGLVAEGSILSTLPMFERADIRFSLRDGEAQLFKTFTLDELSVPPPLQLRQASLTLFASSRRGLGAEGRVDFGLQGAGRGFLAAEASTHGGLSLSGGFDFDSRYFEPANITARYDITTGQLSASGDLGFKPGVIPGVRSGTLHAEFSEGAFRANGRIVPNIPGLEEVNLTATHSPELGLQLHGDATVHNLPGVRDGRLAVNLSRVDAESPWNVSANGELQPAIPGINATLRARYADGAFTASVDTPFSIGDRVSGTLLVGVSNLPSDSEGRPLEGATPGDSVMAFGHGTATVRLSDTFQGDFGIRVGTDAALAISGSVGIREPVTLFEQRRWQRELVRFPTVSIPIFGFAVGGNVVGIAATLGGGVNAEASVGPGQIDQGSIGITDFNPALPDTLHVTGRVRFVVPAQAGIAGHLDAGISAGAAVIRATGGLSINLGLGVDAGVQTPIDLDWTAAQGLVLQATLQASATPRLRASVGGFAEVVADAFVTSFTLWRRDYTLAEREFGSALTVGVTVPVAWRQHGGLDFDFNRVQFQVPEISPSGALADLLRDGGNDQQRNEPSR